MAEFEAGNPSVRVCEIKYENGNCGFNVTKNKWDPYPWVSTVEEGSPASAAGVQPGDCLLEINGDDMLGLRVAEVAARIKARGGLATVMLWSPTIHPDCSTETLCCGPMPTNLQRLATCMNNIVEAMECPVCLDMTAPPAHQCVNGHIICLKCRTQTDRCPVCRVRLFRGRSLLSDQIYDAMIDAFDLRREDDSTKTKLLVEKVCGPNKKKSKKNQPQVKINILSPTNRFLSKFMGAGKSSSEENLSYDCRNDVAGLKTKSLSSSEICKIGTVAGSTLSLSSRPGSGLLDVAGSRAASYHGSTEDLRSRLIADFDVDIPGSDVMTRCPLAPECDVRVRIASLKQHLVDHHDVPTLQHNRSQINITQHWLDNNALIILQCFKSLFFVRWLSPDRLMVWSMDESPSFQYTCSVKTEGVVLHCDVIPLTDLFTNEYQYCGVPFIAPENNSTITLTIVESLSKK